MNGGNPYRVLFPVGCLSGMAGAFLWVAFRLGWVDFYPAASHANLMIGGFLLSYALGFLWTAVPRFLQAPAARAGELASLAVCLSLVPPLALLAEPRPFFLAVTAALGLTFRFGLRRISLRKANPPPSFAFVGAGLALAFVSTALLALPAGMGVPEALLAFARAFFLKGLALCLVLGVGGRLIPALLGHIPPPQDPTGTIPPPPLPQGFVPLVLVLVVAGIALESQGLVPQSGVALFLALGLAAGGPLRLGRLPRVRSALAWSVWASSWAICLSPLLLSVFPGSPTHFWHLVFISGFGLLTLAVSFRVTLAHGGHDFQAWERKPGLYVVSALVLLAAATRISAPFLSPERILSHYAYAAILWILALLCWLFFFWRLTRASS